MEVNLGRPYFLECQSSTVQASRFLSMQVLDIMRIMNINLQIRDPFWGNVPKREYQLFFF